MVHSKTSLLISFAAAAQMMAVAHAGIITGTSGSLNGGSVTAYADVNGSDLNAVGFQVSGSAVRNPGSGPGSVFVDLPSQASGTGFLRLEMDWNPQGHPPPGVYDVPHFDFHFYYIPDSQRTTIPGGQVSPVASKFLPSNYSQPGPAVPQMGGHALDLMSPELNGGTFTQTFIYGYYQGQEIFLEPMATQAYLQGLSGSTSFDFRQPSQYGIAMMPSLVPTTVDYAYDSANDLYTISLGNFVNPVPEPSGLSLLALALPFTLWFGWRRARAVRL